MQRRLTMRGAPDANGLQKVTLIDTDQEPELPPGGELVDYLWWDRISPIRKIRSVDEILSRWG